jgi:hypothetical protein
VPSGNGVNSYTFMNPSFAKIMINQADGKLKTRLIPHVGNYSDYDSAGRVDDSNWHHYALVYDKAQGAFSIYLDYARVSSTTLAPATGTSREFLFGGETATSQTFAGNLDDFRLTKRALRPHEFLTSRAVVSAGAALLAHFDGDYSTSQDAVLAPSGSGAAISGASSASSESFSRKALLFSLSLQRLHAATLSHLRSCSLSLKVIFPDSTFTKTSSVQSSASA